MQDGCGGPGGHVPRLENRPPHIEGGAGGVPVYASWWHYKEQLAGKRGFTRGDHGELEWREFVGRRKKGEGLTVNQGWKNPRSRMKTKAAFPGGSFFKGSAVPGPCWGWRELRGRRGPRKFPRTPRERSSPGSKRDKPIRTRRRNGSRSPIERFAWASQATACAVSGHNSAFRTTRTWRWLRCPT